MTMIIIVMGVSGCGKTTTGELLAKQLGGHFYDADNFHGAANVAKMASGSPLTDADRLPWLNSLADAIERWASGQEPAVLACSCLKQSYREILLKGVEDATLVYLKISPQLARERLESRLDHYMKANLLDSQFATLEEPSQSITLEAACKPEDIVSEIVRQLAKR